MYPRRSLSGLVFYSDALNKYVHAKNVRSEIPLFNRIFLRYLTKEEKVFMLYNLHPFLNNYLK